LEKPLSISNAIKKTQAIGLAAIIVLAIVAGAAYYSTLPQNQQTSTSTTASTVSPSTNNTLIVTDIGAHWADVQYGDDPALDGAAAIHTALIYETLFAYDPYAYRDNGTYKVVPWLVQNYSVSSDGLVYTMTLRHGITFHSGDPMTANDVVYSLNRLLFYNWTPMATYTSVGFGTYAPVNFKSIQKVDNYTFTITLTSPTSTSTVLLPYLAYAVTGILDSKLVIAHTITLPQFNNTSDFGYTWLNNGGDAGSGPYEALDINPSTYTWQVQYFNGYWGGPPELHLPTPSIKKIIIVKYDDDTAARLALLKGDVDIANGFLANTEAALSTDPTIQTFGGPSLYGMALNMHTATGPLKDWRVREAIKMAINYTEIVQVGAQGGAMIEQGSFGRQMPGYNATANYFPGAQYARANQLLDEAGYPIQSDGYRMHINLYIRPAPRFGLDFTALALVLRQNLQNIHIDVLPIVLEPSDYYSHVYTVSEPMMWIQPYDYLNSPIDAIGYEEQAAGQINRVGLEPGGKYGWNETTQPASMFNGTDIVAQADSLYDQASMTTNTTQRIALLQQLDILMLQYGPNVGLCQATNHVAYSAQLTGVFWGPKNLFSSIWFIQWKS